MEKQNYLRWLLPLLKVASPPVLGALGATFAIVYSEGFQAFCGLR